MQTQTRAFVGTRRVYKLQVYTNGSTKLDNKHFRQKLNQLLEYCYRPKFIRSGTLYVLSHSFTSGSASVFKMVIARCYFTQIKQSRTFSNTHFDNETSLAREVNMTWAMECTAYRDNS